MLSNDNIISNYPNPASTILNIHQSSSSPNEQVIITDILGHEVYKAPLTGIDNTIELTKWSSGVYFYEVRSEKETFRGKIIRN
ncbi:MAG: T9SS type A sorting domain-containing protein [Bacteroidota bacterium]